MSPTPDPRDAIIGRWQTTGEVLDAAGATTETLSGTDAYEWLGPFVLHRVDVTMGGAAVRALEVIGPFDAALDGHPTWVFDGAEGRVDTSFVTRDGAGVWTFRSGDGTSRAQAALRADPGGERMAAAWSHTTDDGATWTPWMRMTFTRIHGATD